MGAIMGNIFGKMADKSADETIAYSMMGSAAAKATAYLTAVLEAPTPEVRRLFGEYLTQTLVSHEEITEQSIKKGWLAPYEPVTNQLDASYQRAQMVMETMQ